MICPAAAVAETSRSNESNLMHRVYEIARDWMVSLLVWERNGPDGARMVCDQHHLPVPQARPAELTLLQLAERDLRDSCEEAMPPESRLGAYYRSPAVRSRIAEYCGVPEHPQAFRAFSVGGYGGRLRLPEAAPVPVRRDESEAAGFQPRSLDTLTRGAELASDGDVRENIVRAVQRVRERLLPP